MLNLFKSKKKDSEQEGRIRMFINAGIEYYKKRDYATSRKYFERVLEVDACNAEAQHYLESVKLKIEQEEQRRLKEQEFIEQTREQENAPVEIVRNPPAAKTITREAPAAKTPPQLGETRDKFYYYKALRIEQNAAPDDIREAIANEFKKWRTRVNSPDITKRYEAEEMLNIISQAKRVLLSEK